MRSLDEQGEYESRRLWKPTVDALAKRDHTVATDEKFKIEDEQRDLAKKRLEDGVEFHPKFFRPVNDKEIDLQDLEYVIYKKFDLNDDPEILTKEVMSIAPIVPGQKYEEKFEIPAFKKHEQS